MSWSGDIVIIYFEYACCVWEYFLINRNNESGFEEITLSRLLSLDYKHAYGYYFTKLIISYIILFL